jgi:hypothetical protein
MQSSKKLRNSDYFGAFAKEILKNVPIIFVVTVNPSICM